jgi:hypothetical protein
MNPFIDISVVAFKGERNWVAQCVEYDIAAFAESPSELHDALSSALVANLCINEHLGRRGLDGIPPAPAKFREMFETSRARLSPVSNGRPLPEFLHLTEMRVA